jgi:TrmH family RNA methyltransferase
LLQGEGASPGPSVGAPTRGEERELRALRSRRNRERSGRFLAEGTRGVRDLLASPLTVRLVVSTSSWEDDAAAAELRGLASERGVTWRSVSDAELTTYADTDTPQGIVAVGQVPTARLESLEPRGDRLLLLVLDAVQDPGNVGTLVRTAEALGAAGVVLLPGTVDPWNPKAVRAASGACFRTPLVAAGWERLRPWLGAADVRLFAAAAGAPPLPESLPPRVALAVGNEGAGISAATRRHADALVGIPLRGGAESLNVAAAAAILLFQLQPSSATLP